MHGCRKKLGSCSIISSVSSMPSLAQSSHESLKFLSNNILMVFARKIMKRPNSSLFLRSKDEQGSMLDLGGLEVT